MYTGPFFKLLLKKLPLGLNNKITRLTIMWSSFANLHRSKQAENWSNFREIDLILVFLRQSIAICWRDQVKRRLISILCRKLPPNSIIRHECSPIKKALFRWILLHKLSHHRWFKASQTQFIIIWVKKTCNEH